MDKSLSWQRTAHSQQGSGNSSCRSVGKVWEKNKCQTPKANGRVFSNTPDRITLQKIDQCISSNFKVWPWHPASGFCCRPCSSTRLPGHYSNSPLPFLRTLAPLVRSPRSPHQKGFTPLLRLSGSYSIAAASTVTSKRGALCFANHSFYSPLVWEWKNYWCCLCSQRSRGRCTPRCFLHILGERCAQSSGTHSAS